jgi:hypothetical protein
MQFEPWRPIPLPIYYGIDLGVVLGFAIFGFAAYLAIKYYLPFLKRNPMHIIFAPIIAGLFYQLNYPDMKYMWLGLVPSIVGCIVRLSSIDEE